MIVVTGGAGFIGSALVAALNKRGQTDIWIVDEVDHPEKKHNLAPLSYTRLLGISEFRNGIAEGAYNNAGITGLVHLGACSSTLEMRVEYLKDVNVEYSKELIAWSVAHGVRMVYASSAATYGDGEHGYVDAPELFDVLKPLNPYGASKLAVDIWARDAGYLTQVAGVRYFNVFGPNEFHKEGMRSVMAKKFPDIAAGRGIELFKSYVPEYGDGEQVRDFIYVKDAVAMTLFLLDTPAVSGVFNVGTGHARSWNAVARALFAATGMPEDIRYVDMPAPLKEQYQYFTEADMSSLMQAGWQGTTYSLEDAIREYVTDYLAPHRHLGEV